MRASQISIVVVVAALGAAIGLGSYTFAYARGWAYMTDGPRACANCHVMNEQYDGWTKSSHRSVAVCNDCHVPDSFIGKFYVDFVESENSNGFHAPQEAARILGEAIDYIRQGQLALRAAPTGTK